MDRDILIKLDKKRRQLKYAHARVKNLEKEVHTMEMDILRNDKSQLDWIRDYERNNSEQDLHEV